MPLEHNDNNDLLWAERKILLNFILLNFPKKKWYCIDDFRFPSYLVVKFDQRSDASPLQEVISYDHFGIIVKEIIVNDVLPLVYSLELPFANRY